MFFESYDCFGFLNRILFVEWCLWFCELELDVVWHFFPGLHARTVEEYDILAQASGSRLSESIRNSPRLLRKLSLRRRALVLSEKSSRSSEEVSPKRENVKAPLFHCSSSHLGESSSLERENLSCLSECFQPERTLCRDVLKCYFLLCYWLVVTWLIGLPYLKHEVCKYACIKWFVGWNWWAWYEYAYDWLYIGIRLLCMINLWLVSETWLWYELDVIPWISLWDLMVVPYVMDVIPWASWWDLMVVLYVMDIISRTS